MAMQTVNLVKLVDVTPTLDTAIYATGDVLFVSTPLLGAIQKPGGEGILESVAVIDKDDQGVAIDLYFFDSNVTTGAFNGAPSISDADAAKALAIVPVAAADFKDLGGVRVANIKNIGAVLKAAAGSRALYVAGVVNSGTPTFTAAGLVLRFGITSH